MATTSAAPGDILEVFYCMKLQNGTLIASSGESSSIDTNFFFALGGVPSDPLPAGWDYGIFGMSVGETRLITNPPCLGFGAAGLSEYGIPTNAYIVYNITLVSINGKTS